MIIAPTNEKRVSIFHMIKILHNLPMVDKMFQYSWIMDKAPVETRNAKFAISVVVPRENHDVSYIMPSAWNIFEITTSFDKYRLRHGDED